MTHFFVISQDVCRTTGPSSPVKYHIKLLAKLFRVGNQIPDIIQKPLQDLVILERLIQFSEREWDYVEDQGEN